MINLKKDIKSLWGVGSKREKNFQKLGIKTVEDLIYYFPRSYRDFSRITNIRDAKINEKVAIKITVSEIKNRPTRRRGFIITEALVSDKTGTCKVLWFNQPYLLRNIKKGDLVLLAGNLEFEKELVLKNPEYEVVKEPLRIDFSSSKNLKDEQELVQSEFKHLGRISPVYRESANITSRQLRWLMKSVLDQLQIKDFLPDEVKKSQKLAGLREALREIHFPRNQKSQEGAKRRLSFDEVFIPQLSALLVRKNLENERSFSIKIDLGLAKKLKNSLPFKLTNSQKKTIWQIIGDIEREKPMNRLLEGDVGSGKTVVAAFVLMLVAKAGLPLRSSERTKGGYQGVLMVPTEILAWEHFQKIKKFLENFGANIEILTGSTKTKEKKDILKRLKEGKIDILIGTHALIDENLEFKNLALAVIDEQHRFGVMQRKALKDKDKKIFPHFLSMTATPIPRTMALTVYGDLDISVLKEMPKGERKVKTYLVPPEKRLKAYEFIKKEIGKGHQAFVICPTILKSDKLGVRAVEDEYEKLSKSVFRDLRIDFLHGKMKPDEKKEKMSDLKKGLTRILISTSVVEVGIDIPRLKIMMIEGADRFGLAQLHQMRGRIGRAGQESYFLLFTDSENPETLERLKALVRIKDGFRLADFDLSLRGPGEVMGIKQSGYFDFKLASYTDFELIKEAKTEALKIIATDSSLRNYPQLRTKIDKLKEIVHLE